MDYLIKQILASFSPPNVSQLSILLSALSTRAGTLLLTGHATPFPKLDVLTREKIVINWMTSHLSPFRKLAKTFISVPLFAFYSNVGPAIEAIGYPFMGDPERATKLSITTPKPYAYQFQSITDDLQVFTTDILIAGSGSGGGVAASVLSKAGYRVTIVEQGQYIPCDQLAGTQTEGWSKMFLGNGILTAEEGCISVLAGGTFGGGSTSKLLVW